MIKQIFNWKKSLFFLFSGVIALPSLSQVQREQPCMKSTRTFVYKAIQKDTAWTTGAIVDQIYFVRYDKQGRKLVENLLNPDGSAKSKLIYIYGGDGCIKEEITASVKQGGVTGIYQYSYDDRGRLNGKTRLNADRNVVLKDTVLRDEEGKVVMRISEGFRMQLGNQDKTKNRRVLEFVYGKDGQIEKVIEEDSDSPKLGKHVRQLQKGDTVALKRFSEGDSMRPRVPKSKKVDFDYDVYGNWVKRTEYEGVNPEFIVVRDIEYAGQDTDWNKMGLKGFVKSVLQTSYVAIPKAPGSIDKGKKQGVFFRCEFDEKGRKTVEQSYSDTGIAENITEYIYDTEGNVIREIWKSSNGKLLNTVQWSYDAKGLLKNKTLFDANEGLLRKGVFRYDMEGNCVREIWYGKDSSKYSEFRYQYDSYGQMMAKDVLTHQEEGAEYEPLKRVWNAKGRIAEEWKGLPQDVRHYTYRYSTRGELISGTESVEGQPDVSYVYKFYNDEQGNWKKRVKFIGDVPVLYEEREYTYYK